MKKVMIGILILIPIIVLVVVALVSVIVSVNAHIAVEDLQLRYKDSGKTKRIQRRKKQVLQGFLPYNLRNGGYFA